LLSIFMRKRFHAHLAASVYCSSRSPLSERDDASFPGPSLSGH
jgi:hypothetical protein